MPSPAVSVLRTARTARPALSPPRPLALPARASLSTRERKSRPAFIVPPESQFEWCAEVFEVKDAKPNEYYRIVTAWQRAQMQKKTDDPNLLKSESPFSFWDCPHRQPPFSSPLTFTPSLAAQQAPDEARKITTHAPQN